MRHICMPAQGKAPLCKSLPKSLGKYLRKRSARLIAATLCALVACPAALSGCSGTGTMYTPESDASADGTADAADPFADASLTGTGQEAAAADMGRGDGKALGDSGAGRRRKPPGKSGHAGRNAGRHSRADQDDMEEPEDPRVRRAYLEGVGSDLFTTSTIDYYYGFTLDGVSLQLPCQPADLSAAGWEIQYPQAEDSAEERNFSIPAYSYEFYDAAPAAEAGQPQPAHRIRVCLANFTAQDQMPAACAVCGIEASADCQAALSTVFGTGLGDPLSSLSAVFGTDPSIYNLTVYEDGIHTLRYTFSDGLTENEKIPVLAEAEEKSMAEFLLARTSADGATIDSLALYYFRLPTS